MQTTKKEREVVFSIVFFSFLSLTYLFYLSSRFSSLPPPSPYLSFSSFTMKGISSSSSSPRPHLLSSLLFFFFLLSSSVLTLVLAESAPRDTAALVAEESHPPQGEEEDWGLVNEGYEDSDSDGDSLSTASSSSDSLWLDSSSSSSSGDDLASIPDEEALEGGFGGGESLSATGGALGEEGGAGAGAAAGEEGALRMVVHRDHWSVITAVQQKAFNWQWFYFPPQASCEGMTLNMKKTTSLLRLLVLDVLKAALDSLAKSPKHEKDSNIVTFICSAAVTYVDTYRTMKAAYHTATGEADEVGVGTPVGQWYAIILKKEGKKVGKNKRLQGYYNECAVAASRTSTILTTSDYESPEATQVSLPAIYGNNVDSSLDSFNDTSNKQASSIIAKCMNEKKEPLQKSWILMHFAILQTFMVFDRLAECTLKSEHPPMTPDEKLGLIMARQVLLDHTQAHHYFHFFQTVEQFPAFAQKTGYFKSKRDVASSCAIPGVAGAEFPSKGSKIITAQLFHDFHAYFE